MQIVRPSSTIRGKDSDLLTGAIVLSASVLFVWTGGTAIAEALRGLVGMGAGVEQILMTAVLLNVALILFGYRRHRDLRMEMGQRIEAEARALSLATTDALTGFRNRLSLNDEGAALIQRAHAGGHVACAMMLDLDHFKRVNDVHGHAAGDVVLKTVAVRLAEVLPPQSIAARLGGDEFAVLFRVDPATAYRAGGIADDMIQAVIRPIDYEGVMLTVTTSLGISRSDHDGQTIDELLRRADIAMYAAKRAGRNRHRWFRSSMENDLHRRNALEAGMRSGIAAGEFVPYYEQQVDLTTGRLLGFEMLARWESPELGLVSPEHFIPIAEETGMIGELSFAVMRRAFQDARAWHPSLSLSVNISPYQLKDPWLSQKILKLLTETRFPPSRLEIEITESALYENLAVAQSIVSGLKNQGVRIALDDFGTGYSSLANLRALPFDRIKIDRSFVMSMNDNSESAAIVQAIARLGDSLGLPVTAEGIETGDIEQRLRQLGLAKGQGWHFGKPMTVEQARQLLSQRDIGPAPNPPGMGPDLGAAAAG